MKQKVVAFLKFVEPILNLKAIEDWVIITQKEKTTVLNFAIGFSPEHVIVEIPTKNLSQIGKVAASLRAREGSVEGDKKDLLIAAPDAEQAGIINLLLVPGDMNVANSKKI